jgi:hypothetical protein
MEGGKEGGREESREGGRKEGRKEASLVPSPCCLTLEDIPTAFLLPMNLLLPLCLGRRKG